MKCRRRGGPGRFPTQAGTTLMEIFVGLFAMSIGLLSVVHLLPIGALEMARAIKDERTAAVAADAMALSAAADNLLSETAKFVMTSFDSGSIDPVVAGGLRVQYEGLADEAASLELQIRELKFQLPQPKAQGYVDRLLGQVRFIERRLGRMAWLLSLVEGAPGVDTP